MWWPAIKAVFGLFALSVAAAGCGGWITSALPRSSKGVERAGIALLGGMGLFSLGLFLIGQISFTRTTIVVSLVAAVLLALRPLWRAARDLTSIPKANSKEVLPPGRVVFLVLTITAIAGTSEITGDWERDTVAYHLLGPKV
jgi:hypothetical protein